MPGPGRCGKPHVEGVASREAPNCDHDEIVEWIAWAGHCRSAPFVKLAKTITTQRAGVRRRSSTACPNARRSDQHPDHDDHTTCVLLSADPTPRSRSRCSHSAARAHPWRPEVSVHQPRERQRSLFTSDAAHNAWDEARRDLLHATGGGNIGIRCLRTQCGLAAVSHWCMPESLLQDKTLQDRRGPANRDARHPRYREPACRQQDRSLLGHSA